MHYEPTYAVPSAIQSRATLTPFRLIRFFLLGLINAMFLAVNAQIIGLAERSMDNSVISVIQAIATHPNGVGPIVKLLCFGLGILALATVILDSFALFQPAPRLQRWTTIGYRIISWSMVVGASILGFFYFVATSSCSCWC